MEHNEIELKLEGLSTPRGEITLSDLTAIAAPLQQLTMRIGRHLAGQDGPGHNTAAVDRSTELRLVAVTSGSTCLQIGFGESDVLIDHDIERRTAEGLFDVWSACASGRRPSWVTPLIAESIARLIEGLGRASSVSLGSASRPATTLRPREVDPAPWQPRDENVDSQPSVMVGVLEAVDLASSTFRLLDAVGNKIPLRRVQDPLEASLLIGQQVRADGPRIQAAGRFRGLDAPTVSPFALPSEWVTPVPLEPTTLVAAEQGPVAGGGDLDDEEFAALMAAIKG